MNKTEQLAALEAALKELEVFQFVCINNTHEVGLAYRGVRKDMRDVAEALREELAAEEMVDISSALRKQFGAGFTTENRGEASGGKS